MNKTLKYACSLLLMLAIAGNQIMSMATANDEDTDEVEQTLQNKLSLENEVKSLNQQIKNLNDTIKSLEKRIKDANKKIDNQQPQLEKIQPQQEQEAELTNRQQELQAELERLKTKNAGLEQEIENLNRQLSEKSQNLTELEGIKLDVAKGFVTENKSYLEKPFSKMEINKLNELLKTCETYKGDRNVEAFATNLGKLIGHKQAYDAANQVVHQPFDKDAVNKAQRDLDKLNHLSESQMKEVENLRLQLNSFKPGLIAFNRFITLFKPWRQNTSSKYVKEDIDRICEQINDEQINQVPYLKEKFAQYMKAIRSEPKTGGLDLEKEIQRQYENAIK